MRGGYGGLPRRAETGSCHLRHELAGDGTECRISGARRQTGAMRLTRHVERERAVHVGAAPQRSRSGRRSRPSARARARSRRSGGTITGRSARSWARTRPRSAWPAACAICRAAGSGRASTRADPVADRRDDARDDRALALERPARGHEDHLGVRGRAVALDAELAACARRARAVRRPRRSRTRARRRRAWTGCSTRPGSRSSPA